MEVGGAHKLLDAIAEIVGYVSAVVMLILVVSITLGIAMRTWHVDNTWTYDVDLFALIWLAFVGAAYTHARGHHVTSGLSPEMLFPRQTTLFIAIRFIIVVGFLAVFTVSGWDQFMNSVQTHETTIDVMSWPAWIATLALPVGTFLWLLAEVRSLLNNLKGRS
jgi:TRAP-type C4-dicarboxylate transport system permease small subunit